MKRNIKLYGSLEKAAGQSDFVFDVDSQKQLFAALRNMNPHLNMTVRGKQFGLVTTDENDENPEGIGNGFNFGDRAKTIHVMPMTEGSYVLIPYIIEAIIAVVASMVITRLTMSNMKTNPNGAGGAKSTLFNGPANSTDQGGPIPQIYGTFLVGSTIIAADEDYVNEA